MKESKIFEVYQDSKDRIYTVNLAPGKRVYDERLVRDGGIEFREWNPKKSKLAAAIMKGCYNIFIRKDSVVLYLGCASGTTVSHVSDIASEGFIFALDFAPVVLRKMVFVAEQRKNIAPILGDANKPQSYMDKVSQVDIIFQDVAQKNQVDIFLKNIDLFLKKDGYALLSLKARSIDVTMKPTAVFSDVRQKLEKAINIIDYRTLEPLERDHCFFICKKK